MAAWEERFESKVDRAGDLHMWTGAKTKSGVGQLRELSEHRPGRAVRSALVASLLVLAGCSGSSAGTEEIVETTFGTTSTTILTSTSEAAEPPSTEDTTTSSTPPAGTEALLTPEQIAACTAPSIPGLPEAPNFRFIAEEKLFECLGVESYRFVANLELEADIGQDFDTVEFNSEAVLVNSSPRFRSTGAVDGRPYEVTRIEDTVWVRNDDGSLTTLDVGGAGAFALLEQESTAAQLALGGVGLTVIGFYGGGAVEVGTEEFEGRTLTRWTAGPEQIADHVNASRVLPVEVDVRSGSIDVWTDQNGFIIKAEVVLEADDIFLNDVPALQFPGAIEGGLIFDGTYDIEYFDFDVPLTIEVPD